jgi:hypothetical protein
LNSDERGANATNGSFSLEHLLKELACHFDEANYWLSSPSVSASSSSTSSSEHTQSQPQSPMGRQFTIQMLRATGIVQHAKVEAAVTEAASVWEWEEESNNQTHRNSSKSNKSKSIRTCLERGAIGAQQSGTGTMVQNKCPGTHRSRARRLIGAWRVAANAKSQSRGRRGSVAVTATVKKHEHSHYEPLKQK